MTRHAELLKEIDRLPLIYINEVFDFVGYLRQKAEKQQNGEIDAYQEMAADTEREQEAREWCNAYFGPIRK
jgi:hypothetical protein